MRTLIVFLLLLYGVTCFAQNVKSAANNDSLSGEISTDTTVMVKVQSPTFPGGIKALSEYLKEHISYTPDAIEKKVEGTVFVSFIVDQNGYVNDIKVTHGIHPSLDKAAVDAVKQMPVWIPGRINGKPAKQEFNLPVKFTLPRKLKK